MNYKYSTLNGVNCTEHRKKLGLVGKDFNIVTHHIDGDGRNNDDNNLEIMTRAEHSKLHFPDLGLRLRPKNKPLFHFDKDGMARCRVCKQRKYYTDFKIKKKMRHGRASICKECAAAQSREYRRRQ